MFENPRRGRQARNFLNKCSENSRSQIIFRTDIFRKLSLGAPDNRHGVYQVNCCAVYQRKALRRLILFLTSCAVAWPSLRSLRSTLHFSETFQTGLRYIVIVYTTCILYIQLLCFSLNRITLTWSWGTLLHPHKTLYHENLP